MPQQRVSLRGLIEKTRNSWHAGKGEYDFSHEVKEAMSGCLACKACSTQCPIKIDVPGFRSRFLQLYHTRYLRPVSDYMVAGVESYTPLMARAPKVFNFFFRQPWLREMSRNAIGMVDLPLLSSPTLRQQLSGHRATTLTLEQLEGLSAEQRAEHVLIVQDPFTSYYDAKVVADFVRLVEKLGYKPVLLPFSPNGKAQHVKGFLTRFARTARKTADFLNRVAQLGMPLVGVDPALVLCYRDEYRGSSAPNAAISRCSWCMNGCSSGLRIAPNSRRPASRGICSATAPKPPRCRPAANSGRRSSPASAPNWRTSASAAAAWRALTAMKPRTCKTRSAFMSYHGIRRCSVCRGSAAWRPAILAAAR